MEIIELKAEGKKLDILKALLKELKISFTTKKEENGYNKEFVQMIKDATKEKGGKKINPEDIWESIK
jgi:non-homologous end joining protein Ku